MLEWEVLVLPSGRIFIEMYNKSDYVVCLNGGELFGYMLC